MPIFQENLSAIFYFYKCKLIIIIKEFKIKTIIFILVCPMINLNKLQILVLFNKKIINIKLYSFSLTIRSKNIRYHCLRKINLCLILFNMTFSYKYY